jgi:glucuronoarabinoxylan endo-1,4-beta-xylanase
MKIYNMITLNLKTSFVKAVAGISFCTFLLACSKGGDDGSGGGNPPPEPSAVNAEITINPSDEKQVIQGFGCATVFNPPNTSALTSQEFDRLFNAGNGQVGLSILRIRIAEENDGWRTTELNHAKEAINRGARVIASPWSPPSRMKTNNSLIGGSLKPDSAEAYARYLDAFAQYMSANGAPVYAVSVQNEPDIQVSYESCDWTAAEMLSFLKNHGQHVSSTKLMAPESFNNNQNFVNTLLSDDAAAANLDLVGCHIYGGGVVQNALAQTKNKEVWMTEHLDTLVTYSANLGTAVEIHNCFTIANFNAYLWWYGKRFYGPIGQDGQVTKRGFIISQFARFIRPGAVRVAAGANSRAEVRVSAYKQGGKHVLVAINTGTLPVNQKFTLTGTTLGNMVPYTTTSTKNVEQGAAITVSGNNFSHILPAGSVTTLVEQ